MDQRDMGNLKYQRVSYGDKYLKEGMLAVYLDMNKGILAFGKYYFYLGMTFVGDWRFRIRL
jgi:hypothetical protein